VDVTVDGADQVSPTTRSMIKGGGGALLREKIILSASTETYILVDSSKIVRKLDRSIPVEVIQFAANSTQEKIRRELSAKPRLRKLDKGYPYFTESGNIILDCDFPEPIEDPIRIEQSLKNIPGVVEAGVFTCKVDKFYVGNPTGDLDSY
jgi:ribose 5-phosphate isomerase A